MTKFGQMKTVFILLVTGLLTVVCTSSYALDSRKLQLDNGLTLLIVERHNLPIIKVAVGIDAGTVREPEDKAGLANLTASLLAEGTAERTGRQISGEIEFVGGSLGASGGDDYITVSLSVLKKDADLGFDLLSDIIINPEFPVDELNKKRERIKGSLRASEEDPGFLASREFKKAVFGPHPYGRVVMGTAETLDGIGRDDVVDFHSAYYVPNNAIMAVVGDITADEIEGLIDRYFSAWKPGAVAPPDLPELNRDREGATLTIDRELAQANIIMGHLGVRRDNPDYYALSVMNYILGGGGFASRLMQNIRVEKGLVYSIYSYFAADRYGGSFRVGLQTKNESANTAIGEVFKEVEMIRSAPVTDAEISDAKSFLTGSFPMRIETSARIAGFLVAAEYYGLGVDYIEDYPVLINSVTKKDILQAAQKYLDPDDFVIVVAADLEKASLKEQY